ncbi:MAG TPA: hypothetical protein DHU89_10090 [Flavobacteriales bacterium]|nr:hypothetical protein [Flavobacteriales bacterium]|tara:strand:+ start:3180 stop:3692 length:513 start_codon:yes stop_codon:yes gene_type:complete
MRGAVICFVIATLALGLFQERVKISINFNLKSASLIDDYHSLDAESRMRAIQKSKIGRPYDYYYSHDSVDLLYRLNVRELSVLKWLGSILFAFGHLCLGLWLLKTLRLKFGKWLVQGYVLLFGSAAVAYIVGVILGVDFYLLARRIVGFLQSPLPVIVLLVIRKIDSNDE